MRIFVLAQILLYSIVFCFMPTASYAEDAVPSPEQIQTWKVRAASGDTEAQYRLGEHFVLFDIGTLNNNGVQWLKQAAERVLYARVHVALLLDGGEPFSVGEKPAQWQNTESIYRQIFAEAEQQPENAEAQYWAGTLCLFQDNAIEEALRFLRKSATQGNVLAILRLGDMYRYGKGVAIDMVQASKYFRQAAEMGHFWGQYVYGLQILEENEPKSVQEAMVWFRKAADQGFALAQCALGNILQEGSAHDAAEAFILFDKAAKQQCPMGMVGLYKCYNNGHGVKKNKSAGIQWLKKAVAADDAEGQYLLGKAYADGDGVMQDWKLAMHWYNKAADAKHIPAHYALYILYRDGSGVERNEATANILLRRSAEGGYALAQNELAMSYEQGKFGVVDEEIAVFWFRRAAQQGLAQGEYNYALALETGKGGLKADPVLALKWYRKAAKKGIAAAKDALQRLGDVE